jgi:Transglutaminase-like superfamily
MTLVSPRELWLLWRLRTLSVPALGERLDSYAASQPAPDRKGSRVTVKWLRIGQRLLNGFSGPVRECAVMALMLRRAGVPAFLVFGCEPVPAPGADGRHVMAWVEVHGEVIAGFRPAYLYPELVRYPAPVAEAGS